MKKSLAVLVLVLVSHLCYAEVHGVTHNFNTLYTASPKKLAITDGNKTGTTSNTDIDLVYNCSGTAEFAYEDVNPVGYRKLTISMGTSTAVATVSSPIDDLVRVEMGCLPLSNAENILIEVSEYSDFRTTVTPESTSHSTSSGIIVYGFPKGTYYVRLKKSNKSDFYVTYVKYYYEPCHCLRVVSQ